MNLRLRNISLAAVLTRSTVLCLLVAALAAGSFAHAQSAQQPEQPPPPHQEDPPNFGVIVSGVEKNSEAEEVGLHVGDRILTWERGSEHGPVPSPFDFEGIAREQAPRGPVTLHGARSGITLSWVLKTDDWRYESDTVWGLKVVGGWPDAAPVIQRIQSLDKAAKHSELVEYCRSECGKLNNDAGQRSYVRYLTASLLIKAGRPRDSQEFIQSALAEKPDAPSFVTVALYEVSADANGYAGDVKTGTQFWQKASREIERLRSPSLFAAYDLSVEALSEVSETNFRESGQLAQKALAIASSLAPHSFFRAECLLLIGQAALHTSDLETADSFTQKGLALAISVRPNSNFVADAHNYAGRLAWRRGDLAAAERHLSQSVLIMSKQNNNPQIMGEALGWLARIETERGNFVRAERYMTRFTTVLNKHSNWGFVSGILLNMAALKLQNGDSAAATRLARQSLDILKVIAPESPFINMALFVYADALRQQGQLTNAEQAYGQLYSRLEAGKGDSKEAAFYHYGMGEIFAKKGDYDRAATEQRAALEILRLWEPRSPYLPRLLGALAEIDEHKGDVPAALADYSEAIRLMDSLSVGLDRSASIHFLAGRAQLSSEYASLLLKRGRVGEAFAALDHAHAQTLLQTLNENKVGLLNRAPSDLRLKDQKLESQLSELSEQRVRWLSESDNAKIAEIDAKIAEASTDHDLLEAQMRAADQGYAFLTQPTSPSVRQIQNSLDSDTALLEYALDKDGSLLLAVDRHRLLYYRLKPNSAIDKLVRLTYSKFSRSAKAKEISTAELELSDAVLGPAAGFLKGHNKLLVVADGSLQYIPFAALPLPQGFGPGRPLVGSLFEVANLPSASFLCLSAKPRPHAQGSNSVAVLADPVFAKLDPRVGLDQTQLKKNSLTASSRGGEAEPPATSDDLDLLLDGTDDSQTRGVNLTRLLHSREEAAAIAAVSPKQDFFMAVDFNANRATALDPRVTGSRIIHFATHGIFDSKNPAMSGLVFSLVDKQGKPQAGFLGLDDVYRLRLSADLVVMSACETALGEEVKGEGLVGLTWGFIYAGAKNVVASLWRVDDASTAELMRIFYNGIEREGLTPAAALRKAQMAIASQPKWSAPYYWAGFVVEGQYAK